MKTVIRLAAIAMAVFAAATCQAQNAPAYPTKQVRVIVPYPAGGPTDVIGRLLAQKLGDALHQNFYVENLPGAGGLIGSGTAAKAAPDGHTLLLTTNDFAVASVTTKSMPYDPIKNFTPVSIVSASPQVVIAHPSVAAKSLSELIELAKKEPGKMNYGSMSVGFGQLTAERFFRQALKVDMVRVPFQGAVPLINSTVGGHTQLGFIGLPPASALIKDGKLRALAVVGSERSRDLPDVPTSAEAGVPGQEANLQIGVVAPAGTPKEIVDLLQQQIARIVTLPDVKSRLEALGFTPVASTPDAYAAQMKKDIETWGKVVADLGIPVQ